MPQWLRSVFPFPGAPYAGHGPALAGRHEQESEQVALDLQHRSRETLVACDRMQARGFLRREHRFHSRGGLPGRLLGPGVEPQRAAVSGQFVHVDHP